MSDAELSRDLALALGYYPESVHVEKRSYAFQPYTICYVYRHTGGADEWCEFDYRSPSVVVPLIKMLMLEGVNVWNPDGIPTAWEWSAPDGTWGKADTLEAAVAKAVIAVRKG